MKSNFGARYYTSDLSIWLSVDPLSDNTPFASPYAYCINNPIILHDPNGEDWEVNESGYIRQTGDPNNNVLYAVKGKEEGVFGDRVTDKKGNEKSIDVDKDIMKSLTSEQIKTKDETYNFSKMDVTGKDDKAKSMFKFLSKNTDVEWSYWGGKSDDKEYSFISTSHLRDKSVFSPDHALSKSLQNGLSFFFHSHPRKENGGMFSNDIDRAFSSDCKRGGSPNAVFGIMHRGTLYDLDAYKMNWDGTRK